MYRNQRIYCFVFSALIVAVLATAAIAQAGKIGIVNIQDAITNTNEGKKELSALQTRFGPKSNELKARNDEMEKLKAQLQALADKMSEEARNTQIRTLSDKAKTLQRDAEDFQAEV